MCKLAKDMGPKKSIITLNRCALNAPVTIWQTIVTASKDLVISDVFYVVETITKLQRMHCLQWATKKAYSPLGV
jgi:hypothetical protein